jgi:hypothetical protein
MSEGLSQQTLNETQRIDGHRQWSYWQKTKITGGNPSVVARVASHSAEQDEPIGPSRNVNRSSAVSLGARDPAELRHRRDQMAVNRALAGMERRRPLDSSAMAERVNELQTRLEIRTSKEIFEALQTEHEERRVREEGEAPRKRVRRPANGQSSEGGMEGRPRKRVQRARGGGNESFEGNASEEEEVAAIMRALDEEFEEKERQSHERVWCEPVPHERKVLTVREFYNAFHDAETLPIHTCTLCYRKFPMVELEEVERIQSMLADLRVRYGPQFGCRSCFASDKRVLGCAECRRELRKGSLSPAAHVHNSLRCEHAYPDELKDLSPVEEKLIALNSCYGFITKFSVFKGYRQSATYPKHIKGHITVFPNNVQELVTGVLPHPLVKVMEEIHVSWQGVDKPAPKDLSVLLSVRRRAVERALVWLKRNNPHYANIEIDTAEMESWCASSYGVPDEVYERMEHDEPSAWEKTRTAQLVPPTERGLEAEGAVDVREILATLNQEQAARDSEMDGEGTAQRIGNVEVEEGIDGNSDIVQEINASGMFGLDTLPDVEDTQKLQYLYDALGHRFAPGGSAQGKWTGSAGVRTENTSEPYIAVSRGENFADSKDAWLFAKAFPTLFPYGGGGPRQAEENMSGMTEGDTIDVSLEGEATARSAVSSRNLGLETWARIVLQRHGGRFASHRVFTFLVFNMLVRFRNHRVSMMSVTKKEFPEVERVVQSLSVHRLEKARDELQASGKTSDADVNQLLRSLSLYGFRQPMSRELRLAMRRKIKSFIIREGIPAIWFTLNPNDITNPVKLRLAAYRTRDPEEAEAFLTSLDLAYKRMRLAISDPLSSALFFHREISMFFKYYVKVGEPSVFGRVNQYFGAVETNERGALHLHGLLWFQGNIGLSSLWKDFETEHSPSYRERVLQYVDSVFTEVWTYPSLSVP